MVLRRQDRRGLTTLLFTDIVGSSDVAVELGDRRWRHLQARHHAEVRKQLRRHGGREVDTAGDGFFATFGSPAAGVRCAFAIVKEMRELGLDIRAGLHIGEAELAGEKVGGIAVTTAQRVESAAGPGQVFATDTIVHLVAGSGLEFTDLGSRELKGVPGHWELFSLDAVDGESIGSPLDPTQAAEYRLHASPADDRARQRRWLIPVAALTSLVLIGGLLFLQRRGSVAAPPTSSGSGAITESLAVLSAGSGALSKRVSIKGFSAGPIVLSPAIKGVPFAWVLSGGCTPGSSCVSYLSEVNRQTDATVDTWPAPPKNLAAARGTIWFLISRRFKAIPDLYANGVFVQGIDIRTNEKTTRWPVNPSISVGGNVRGLAAGDGALWFGDTVNSRVFRFDLIHHSVDTYPINGSVDGVAFGGDSLWVLDSTNAKLIQVNPANRHQKSTPLDATGDFEGITVGGGRVWITDANNGLLWGIAADLGSRESIPVGDRPLGVAYSHGTVWVANYGSGTVSKVDPGLRTQLPFPVGIHPTSVAVAGNEVWVAGDRTGIDTS